MASSGLSSDLRGSACSRPGIGTGTAASEVFGRRQAACSAEDVGTRDCKHAVTFVFGLSDGSVLDGAQGGNATRHINHSCAPNCVAYEIEAEGRVNFIQIETLRKIAAGEELFLDYGLDAGEGAPEDFPCRCGATECRGSLVAAEVHAAG